MRQSKAGVALLLSFVASQAIRDVFLRHLFGNLGLFEVALVAFGTAAIVFGLGLALLGRQQIKLLMSAWREVIAVNVTTLVAWLSYFGALRLVEPAAVNLAFSGIAPVAVAMLGMLGLSSATGARAGGFERLLHWSLFGTIVLLATVVATGRSGSAHLDPITGLAGVALAAFAGFVITAESIIAKRMNEMGIAALSIVGVRFSLVTALAAVVVARTPEAHAGVSGGSLAQLCIEFLAVLVGPIYLAQAGLRLTTPLLSSVILAIGPITTLLVQTMVGAVVLSPGMLVTTALYAIVSFMAAVIGSVGSKEARHEGAFVCD